MSGLPWIIKQLLILAGPYLVQWWNQLEQDAEQKAKIVQIKEEYAKDQDRSRVRARLRDL